MDCPDQITVMPSHTVGGFHKDKKYTFVHHINDLYKTLDDHGWVKYEMRDILVHMGLSGHLYLTDRPVGFAKDDNKCSRGHWITTEI